MGVLRGKTAVKSRLKSVQAKKQDEPDRHSSTKWVLSLYKELVSAETDDDRRDELQEDLDIWISQDPINARTATAWEKTVSGEKKGGSAPSTETKEDTSLKERVGIRIGADVMTKMRTYLWAKSADEGTRSTQSDFIEEAIVEKLERDKT